MSSSSNANATQAGARDGMSQEEFTIYNALSVKMDQLHAIFRTQWTTLQEAVKNKSPPKDSTTPSLVQLGLDFCTGLAMHHKFEEAAMFPVLAAKMPDFRHSHGSDDPGSEIARQHEVINAGVLDLRGYLEGCKEGTEGGKELDWDVLEGKMESWGGVLWRHLDEEVEALGAANMKKYWTLEEMKKFPW